MIHYDGKLVQLVEQIQKIQDFVLIEKYTVKPRLLEYTWDRKTIWIIHGFE